MTDERPINAWCRKYNEAKWEADFERLANEEVADNYHDSGDEDPNAWSDD